MDSLTQFVLGAAVSTACLGPKIGPRKAALLGGLLGTLPDLDVLQPFADPIDSFVYHRGWSHSLFVHALATPIIGEGLVRLFKGWKEHRWRVWATVFLCLSTHAIIDALTIYGTRLFWPIYPDPVGTGSIFIIDPIYTLPLLAVVIWAFCKKSWSSRFRKGLTAALVFSTAYQAWGLGVQAYMTSRAERLFADAGIEPDKIMAQAGPFNTVLWKIIGLEGDRYHNLYLSLFDKTSEQPVYSHPRHPELVACLEGTESYRKLEWFTHGFFRTDREGDKVTISDLRMGMTPSYTFSFAIAQETGGDVEAIFPERNMAHRRGAAEGDLEWLKARIVGEDRVRSAEKFVSADIKSNFSGLGC